MKTHERRIQRLEERSRQSSSDLSRLTDDELAARILSLSMLIINDPASDPALIAMMKRHLDNPQEIEEQLREIRAWIRHGDTEHTGHSPCPEGRSGKCGSHEEEAGTG